MPKTPTGRPIDLKKLEALQRRLAEKVILEDRFKQPIRVVAGVDLAFLGETAIAACVAVDYNSMETIEEAFFKHKLKFPYIPGFLSFREGPAMIFAMKKLRVKPQVFLINAHGIAHPRFLGCASQVGVLTGQPTIGVAQRILCGTYKEEPKEPGQWTTLTYKGRTVGALYKSKKGSKPIIISPGHKTTLKTAIKIVKKCIRGHKLPEPLQKAHRQANKEKMRLMEKMER